MAYAIVKSIGVVLTGIIIVVVLSVATDAILKKAGVFPPGSDPALFLPWMLALALIYRCVYAVLSGYIIAWLAPVKPMRLVAIAGVIGFAISILGVLAA